MSAVKKPVEQTVACEVCTKEVPLSAAKTAEGFDYVMHFCGLDCYEAWQRKKAERDKDGAAERD
jgi:hypothetical protein